tara:strand:+ start:2495 stop:2758 length:264 start_codon:yes stop_codon:yes gene_type:complete
MSGKDTRVTAIRSDSRVGIGTCTSIDECFSGRELVEALNSARIYEPEAAVEWAHRQQRLHLEISLNYSSGEADCPLLKAYNDWVAYE